ncbi:hypothetical protein ANOM_000122 [Aspergillus nomiae NRRL 13137]|uniref:Zn(2)-C6 fungal-type domain-containing protein n=1 Tax=Aspergillus nomiae NRRL (strain ATCC 15546 / NRRL 13137 / CBS 260.88 / M93) TaxID=1509407 RepID=A0A0L1JI98_ASPN3|nr:uncharacterized protein ANOM_000122 [Aspergillus nomiae NRRL 13137]KNG91490.1 hypothetical protein ANOM_000122 [Aspergillus nomiae NRRL 13137]
MVNRGRSKGCVTCKQRRVKCDEAKPECWHCRRLGLHCEGYQTKYTNLKFRDQTHKFFTSADQDRACVPSPQPLAEPDTSVPFFLKYYVGMGRNLESARGLFEILIPVYCSERQGSPLSLAISAVASGILSLWRRSVRGFQLSRKAYTEAIACMRNAVNDRVQRRNPATVLAALVLQHYESVAAVYDLRSPSRVHHNGAVSLLQFAEADRMNGTNGAYIRRFMLHTEVSSAMRQKRPVQSIAYSWVGGKRLMAAPENPSSVLDVIGVSVAEFQANYIRLVNQDGTMLLSWQVLEDWRAEAKRIDRELLDWAQNVPDHWQPRNLTPGQDIDESIPTYRSVCEVYPSCQIANIWNLWRFQRLLLLKITVDCLQKTIHMFQVELTKEQASAVVDNICECQETLQRLVDSVCYSVPFFLGNRTRQSTITDFTDSEILIPSYPLQAPEGKKSLNTKDHDAGRCRDDHRYPIIAQGPWHIMSPLSHLLTLFSEGNGQLLASFLRPGQQAWIRAQFQRVTTLLHLSPKDHGEDQQALFDASAGNINTDNLARGVRKGLIFMSGP